MNNPKFWAKLRPTAVIFALIMGGLVWVLTSNVLSGQLGALAFGDGQAGAVVSAALIVIGTAIAGLSNALQELSKDAPDPPDPPPQQVPEQVALELISVLYHTARLNPPTDELVVEESHTRPREGIEAGES